MSRLNVCILGCGKIAKLHSRIGKTLRKDLVFSYASRDAAKAEEYNRRFKGAGAFGSYEFACMSKDVDAVFICTPHAFHPEHAQLAAGNGKAMLIEKPIARSLSELAVIETAVSTAGVQCMVAENYYFKPLVRVIRQYIDNGDIGEPLFFELHKTGTSRNTGWRRDSDLMGGGALLEGGVHWVNLMTSICGPAREVCAAQPMVAYDHVAPVEDNLQLLVKFQSGTVGQLLHSWQTKNRIGGLSLSHVYGTEGNIAFESNGLWVVILGKRKRIRVPGLLDIMGYRAMLKAFVKSVRDDTRPDMSLAVARHDLELVFGAYRSLRSGRFEPIGALQTQPQIPALMERPALHEQTPTDTSP